MPVELSQKIQRLRNQSRLAYAQVARAVDCSTNTVRDIEAGRTTDPSFRIVLRLSEFFNVPLDWLADDAKDWPPPKSQEQAGLELIRQALHAAGLVGELSPQEREALAVLRSLDDGRRGEVIAQLKGLAGFSLSAGPVVKRALSTAEADEARRLHREMGTDLAEADQKHKAEGAAKKRSGGA